MWKQGGKNSKKEKLKQAVWKMPLSSQLMRSNVMGFEISNFLGQAHLPMCVEWILLCQDGSVQKLYVI